MVTTAQLPDKTSVHQVSPEMLAQPFSTSEYASSLSRFHRPWPETYAWDSSRGNVLFFGAKGAWYLHGTFGLKLGRICGWGFQFAEPVVYKVYSFRTATPTGSRDWIALQAQTELQPPQIAAKWLEDSLKTIFSFRGLSANWDGYGGIPPDKTTRSRAVSVATRLARLDSATNIPSMDPPFIAPLSSGGVLFEIRNRSRELHLTIYPSDPEHCEVLRILTTPSGDEIEEEKTIPESDLDEVLHWIAAAG
jgi:hypothetical protein